MQPSNISAIFAKAKHFNFGQITYHFFTAICSVMHPGKGGCAEPVNEDAILEGVGGRPRGRNRERQLASDTGDGKT
jgi:hypothetical protein